jgi:hypothetical protein
MARYLESLDNDESNREDDTWWWKKKTHCRAQSSRFRIGQEHQLQKFNPQKRRALKNPVCAGDSTIESFHSTLFFQPLHQYHAPNHSPHLHHFYQAFVLRATTVVDVVLQPR